MNFGCSDDRLTDTKIRDYASFSPPHSEKATGVHHPTDHEGSEPLRVLVIDDDRDNAETMTRLLQTLGCECMALYHSTAALEAAPTYLPDLLLIDLAMPVVDGYLLVAEWRKANKVKGATIVAVSGYCDPQSRQKAFDVGFDDFIAKPYTLADLKRVVEFAAQRLAT